MDYIATYCAEVMNMLRWQVKLAVRKLAAGPLIFGEQHGHPHARAVIAELIKLGAVTTLCLEVAPLGDDPVRSHWDPEETGAFDGVVAELDEKWANPLSMSALIALAAEYGVDVIAYDTFYSYKRRHDREWVMSKRNEAMGGLVRQGPRSVALVGGSHLSAGKTEGGWAGTLQGHAGVDIGQVIDLSRH